MSYVRRQRLSWARIKLSFLIADKLRITLLDFTKILLNVLMYYFVEFCLSVSYYSFLLIKILHPFNMISDLSSCFILVFSFGFLQNLLVKYELEIFFLVLHS